jgi:S-adenosylmethionine:tRNA-ribosyltransferase-isomerase (queuine synthetase)
MEKELGKGVARELFAFHWELRNEGERGRRVGAVGTPAVRRFETEEERGAG